MALAVAAAAGLVVLGLPATAAGVSAPADRTAHVETARSGAAGADARHPDDGTGSTVPGGTVSGGTVSGSTVPGSTELETAAAQTLMAAADHEGRELSAREAVDRVRAQPALTAVGERLDAELEDRDAGAWIDPEDGELVVAVTTAADAAVVTDRGARPRVVARDGAELAAVQARVAALAAERDQGEVSSWYVDGPGNRVVLTVPEDADDPATDEFVALARTAGLVSVQEVPGTVATHGEVVGGQQIEFDRYVCSVGFTARDRTGAAAFVTAGHCARPGTTFWSGSQFIGRPRGASFPGDDYAYASVNTAAFTPIGAVERWNGSRIRVGGHSSAPVGASVCKSGRTTGWTCGVVRAKGVTVNYAEGQVGGLTQTDACTEGGDSGGAWLAGSFAQGITSGGMSVGGRCLETVGERNVAYFQPIGEVLDAYGLTLITR